jgi:hypothetical protein
LWLEITSATNTTTNIIADLTIHTPWNMTNGVYDLEYCTNLVPPVSWQWLLRTDPGQTNLVVYNPTNAQGFYRLGPQSDLVANDSEGTNFWVAFFNMFPEFGPTLQLYISSPVGATGTVTDPALGTTNDFSVAAGEVTNMSISPGSEMSDYDAVEAYGIHITASRPVSVYAINFDPYASVAFTGYPTTLLGTNYCLMARAASVSSTFSGGFYSQFAVVATQDGTTVTITPSPASDLSGHSGTNAYTETMDAGETYQINGSDRTNDVTGTWITSDKPVGVFAGANTVWVPDMNVPGGNPFVQEQLPVEDWGTQALALSFAGRVHGDSYRVLAAYSNTVVTIRGIVVTVVNETVSPVTVTTSNEVVVITNQAGKFYDIIVDGPVQFEATQPIQVAQFANGGNFDNVANNGSGVEGDPCVILLLPTGHYLSTNTVVTLPNDNTNGVFDKNYLNVIAAQTAITNTLVDGSHLAATNFVAIGTSGYYGARLAVTNGVHTVSSSQPVGVEVYGFGPGDAYGYFGGVVK